MSTGQGTDKDTNVVGLKRDEPDRFWLATAFLSGICSGFGLSATSASWALDVYGGEIVLIIATLGFVLGMLCILERVPRLTPRAAAVILIAMGASMASVQFWKDEDTTRSTAPTMPTNERSLPHSLAPSIG